MTDLATLGTAHEAGLTSGERWEVVMVHVTLGLLESEGVQHLLHLEHAQSRYVQDLGLTTLEQSRPVGPLDGTNLDGQRPDVGGASSVKTNAVFDHPVTGDLLENRLEGSLGLRQAIGVVLRKTRLGDDSLEKLCFGVLTLALAGNGDNSTQLGSGCGFDHGIDLIAVVDYDGPLGGRDRHGRSQLELEIDHLTDVLLRLLEALGYRILVRGTVAVGDESHGIRGGSCLDHGDVDVTVVIATTSDDKLEDRLSEVFFSRERNPLALLQPEADSAERAFERDVGYRERRGRTVEGNDVERVLLIDGKRGDHDVGLVAIAITERWAKRAIDEPTGEDGLLRRAALPTEERAGDLAHGVHPLFEVDGEREKIDALSHPGVCGGGNQHFGTAQLGDDGSVGLAGKLAGTQDELFAADGASY